MPTALQRQTIVLRHAPYMVRASPDLLAAAASYSGPLGQMCGRSRKPRAARESADCSSDTLWTTAGAAFSARQPRRWHAAPPEKSRRLAPRNIAGACRSANRKVCRRPDNASGRDPQRWVLAFSCSRCCLPRFGSKVAAARTPETSIRPHDTARSAIRKRTAPSSRPCACGRVGLGLP